MSAAALTELLPYLAGGVNGLVGLMFLAFWLTSREERHNFSLALFHVLLGATIIIGGASRFDVRTIAGAASIGTASLATAFLIEGVWRLQGRPFRRRYTWTIAACVAALDVAITLVRPDQISGLVTTLIGIAFFVVAARLVTATSLFERLAGAVFAVRGAAILAFPFAIHFDLEAYNYVLSAFLALAVGLLMLLASFTRMRQRLEGAVDELIEAYNQLGQLTANLEVRSIEYQEACARAEAANAAKASFLGNMSHELRTPLNAVIGFSDMLASKTDELSTVNLDYVGHIRSAGTHLLGLIDQTLRLADLDGGAQASRIEHHDMRRILLDATRAREEMALAKGIQIRLPADSEVMPVIACDAALVRQALVHLLDSAIRRSPTETGIDIRIQFADENRLGLAIEDGGPTMHAAEIAKAFDPFWRPGSHMTHRDGDLGLALPLAKHLIEAGGGTINLAPRETGGMRVQLVFPRQATQLPLAVA